MNRTQNTNVEPGTGNPEPQRILLVRLRLLGDVALSTPLVGALRRRFPHARLSYLVEPAAAAAVRGNPNLDDVIVAPKPRGVWRWATDVRLAGRLRRARYDIVIDLHGGPRAAWLVRATGAPMRIGYAITGRAWMYTHAVRRAPDLQPRHTVRNQWDLLAPLGIRDPDPARDPVQIVEDPAAADRVETTLRALGIGAGHQIVVIHVSAGNPFRRWPAEAFAALAARLAAADPRRRIVMTSGPSEAGAAARIAAAARARLGKDGDRLVEPALDVAELHALIGRAAVYIGGDSGPLHVASATRTPIVALFGPTLPERSMPWRDPRWFAEAVDAGPLPCRPCRQRVCVTADFRCLARITPDQVGDAAERAVRSLDGGGNKPRDGAQDRP
ncbi:MAG: glycosyltransferase family 9 protein [Vicinamibacterales bacterium]